MQAALGLSPLVRLEKADRQQKERTGGTVPPVQTYPHGTPQPATCVGKADRRTVPVSEKLTEEPSPCQASLSRF